MHAPLAYILPGYGEVVVLLIIGLLLFGRRLPEVGRQLGRTVTEFRRGLNGLRHQLEQGRIDARWADAVRAEFADAGRQAATLLVTPMVLEIVAEKRR